jgi:hypothetical protein
LNRSASRDCSRWQTNAASQVAEARITLESVKARTAQEPERWVPLPVGVLEPVDRTIHVADGGKDSGDPGCVDPGSLSVCLKLPKYFAGFVIPTEETENACEADPVSSLIYAGGFFELTFGFEDGANARTSWSVQRIKLDGIPEVHERFVRSLSREECDT